jgi:hypothetical protein
MSCAPFNNPLDNALSYLYTNKVIDESLNVISPRIDFYLQTFQKQTGEPMFMIERGKLIPIQEAFDRLGGEELEEEIVYDDGSEGPSYEVDLYRKQNAENWTNSDLALPPGRYTQEEQDFITDMLDNGAYEIQC